MRKGIFEGLNEVKMVALNNCYLLEIEDGAFGSMKFWVPESACFFRQRSAWVVLGSFAFPEL